MIAGELSLVAECDEAELVRARQRHPALVDALRVVRVARGDAGAGDRAARAVRPAPRSAGRRSSHDAARRLVELLAAFRRDTAFPGKALAFVDYCSLHKHAAAVELDELDDRAFGAWSGLPVDLLAPERALDTAAIASAARATA